MSAEEIVNAFISLKVGEIRELIARGLDRGEDPGSLLKACQEGMEKIGARFETGEFYLGELVLSAKMFERASEVLKPRLAATEGGAGKSLGTIVLGTPKGDIHDLGKNIFRIMAEASGFRVLDLGIDVPAKKFIESVEAHRAQIVGMSGLLTTTFPSMKAVVDELVRQKLRDRVKVIIGGGATGKEAMRFVGADAQTLDANEGVRLCRSFLEGVRSDD